MRAVVCREWGPVDQLVVEERPSPPLGPNDVRLDVTACGVNYVEGLMVQGLYQVKIPAPFTPGMEVVGRVTEIGRDVTDRRTRRAALRRTSASAATSTRSWWRRPVRAACPTA